MNYKFKSLENKIKIIGASAICLSAFVTGCSIHEFTNSTERVTSNTHIVEYTSDISHESNEKIDFTSESTEPSISEPSEIEEVHDYKLTSEEAEEFLILYCETLGVKQEHDLLATVYDIAPFLFDDEMEIEFVNYYNNLKGTNYTYATREEMQSALIIDIFNAIPTADLYKKDAFDDGFTYSVFYDGFSFVYSNPFSDSIINSILASRNLPANYIFTYDEIKEYLPDLEKRNSYDYMYELFDKYSSVTNMPVREYIGALMLQRNERLNRFGIQYHIDITSFNDEIGERAKPYFIEAYNDQLSKVTGKEENADPFAPMTPEVFKEVYGYDPYDVSLEAIDGYTAGEYVETYQKSR